MNGYFVGQKPEMKKFLQKYNLCNKGYLVNYNDTGGYMDTILIGNTLLEIVLMAPHGTTLGYREVNEMIDPILADNEFKKDYPFIRLIQVAAKDFIKNMKRLEIECLVPTKNYAFSGIRHFLEEPRKMDADIFGDISFTNVGTDKIADKTSIVPLAEFKNKMITSAWKAGFLRRNIQIKLPYTFIYNIARKII